MNLYHVTTVFNYVQIRNSGHLLPVNGRLWFCVKSRLGWALEHVCKRHGVSHASVVIMPVAVPRARLKRHCRGVYSTLKAVRV